MGLRQWHNLTLVGALTGLCTAAPRPGNEPPFLAENAAAMDKMMAGMAATPTGDVDVDFAATMIPHHQGAIDMAQAELRYGTNERLRRIVQEIAAMRLALGQSLPPSMPSPNQDTGPMAHRPAPTR